MKVKVLASGSKGNSAIVLCGDTKIIIDIGISYLKLKRMIEENSLDINEFEYLLITHSHSDHIKGLESLLKHTRIKVCIPKSMYVDL